VRRLLVLGGIVGSLALLAFGVVSVVLALDGRDDVHKRIKREKISGTPDMKPSTEVPPFVTDKPTCDVAGKLVDNGTRAMCFADWMRVHALEATGGKTYAEMPRFIGKDGKPTEDEKAAAKDPKTGQPVQNQQREIWVTETALATALNTSYFAEQEANYALVVGIIMIIAGIGFLVLTLTVLRPGVETRRT
jgi:hypothetical protein